MEPFVFSCHECGYTVPIVINCPSCGNSVCTEDVQQAATQSLVEIVKTRMQIAALQAVLLSTKCGTITTDGDAFYHVEFLTPFPDANYAVTFSVAGSPWPYMASFDNITAHGFDIYTRDTRNGVAKPNSVVSWMVKRYEDP